MKKSDSRKSRYSNVGSANGFTYMPSVVRSAVLPEDLAELERDVGRESDLVPASDAGPEDAWEALGAGRESESEADLPLPDLVFDDALDRSQIRESPTPAEPVEQRVAVIEGPVMRAISSEGKNTHPSAKPVPVAAPAAPASPPPAEEAASRKSVVEKEHPLWALAKMSISLGDKEDALQTLCQLAAQEPTHVLARIEIVRFAVQLSREAQVRDHIDHALTYQVQAGHCAEACQLYRDVRAAFPSLSFEEPALVAALAAADATSDGALVLEATNLLLKKGSVQIPRALLLTAKHQLLGGNNDAAVNTLKYLAGSYPNDPASEPARKKLRELGLA